MKSMVTQVEEVLNEVGLCDFNDVFYKTTNTHAEKFNEGTIQLLAEVSWRTVGLGVSLANIHRHHKTRDNEAKKLKSLGSSLQTSKTDQDRWKILGQIFSVIGNITIPQAKNDWWQGAATASGSVGIDKKIDRVMTLMKDLQRKLKQPKRR
jgi:hypothetical protein